MPIALSCRKRESFLRLGKGMGKWKKKAGIFRVSYGALGKGDQKVILQTNHLKHRVL